MPDWKEWLPATDRADITTRLRELERRAGALPVLSALFFHEGLKSLALFLNIPIPGFIRMFMLSIFFGLAFVYADQRHRAWQKAKEKAQEQKSKLDQSQSRMSDYIEEPDQS